MTSAGDFLHGHIRFKRTVLMQPEGVSRALFAFIQRSGRNAQSRLRSCRGNRPLQARSRPYRKAQRERDPAASLPTWEFRTVRQAPQPCSLRKYAAPYQT